MTITLNIYTSSGGQQVTLNESSLTIGRDESAAISLPDDGLSRVHASIHRDGDRLWILDEGSTNGTRVNGSQVPPSGTPLADGDEIALGHHTSIVISFAKPAALRPAGGFGEQAFMGSSGAGGGSVSSTKVALIFACVVIVTAVLALGAYALKKEGGEKAPGRGDESVAIVTPPEASPTEAVSSSTVPLPTQGASVSPAEVPSVPPAAAVSVQPAEVAGGPPPGASRKLYLQMNPQEQLEFIEKEARHISLMMGNRPYAFNDDVLRYIKQYVDGYAKRVGNNSTRLWGEDLRSMFARAREQFAPHIIRAFNARGVPSVVGLYLVVVETEYHNIRSENFAGAAGLFQFIGPTARGYGVDPSERTNVAKMAPAAAAYISDRIAEFGPDSMSVALGIAGYNRSPDSVRRDLHDVLNSSSPERSFWSLVANSNKLDHYFQGENIKYVPKFFAAAIVGENPWTFGIEMRALSTYTEIKTSPETSTAN